MPRAQGPPRNGGSKLVVLLAMLVLVVAPAIWVFTRPATRPAADLGRTVAEAFLKQVREGHPDLAWQSTTAEFKSAQGRESFIEDVRPLKFLKQPMEFVSLQTVTVQDQTRSEYLFRSPSGETVRLVLGREDGTWKVDRWTR